MAGTTLPERVAQMYYSYGLFISSYSVTAISLALSVVLLCCYPLLNVPLPGNIPTTVNLPIHELKSDLQHKADAECTSNKCQNNDFSLPLEVLLNETQKLPYLWVKEKPLLYIQQIIMKIGVSPWNSNLKLWDAFRGPLQESFRLLETIRNHEHLETKTTILNRCYHIENIKKRDSRVTLEHLLPEYGCLLLSPANLWEQNLQTFALDTNIVTTIHNYQKGKVALSEIAFGMPLRYTGIKRYPLRRRPRVLQFAVTIFYEQYDDKFLNSLSKKLKDTYPLYQDASYKYFDDVTLIYYPGHFNYRELVPLLITFFGLFLYVYFSVRKIEFINSKFGLAACAVVTIAGSLTMSMGICFYFGFSLSLQGKEIFPYLVIIVGLENVLVLTKSVTSTDSRLDVKIRLAQGLSKEGWSITKNLLTEITVFTVSFFTFVPFIQEFSIFMIVSLLSDSFVQMVFFATILGIDVRRMDYFREQNTKFHLKEYFNTNNGLYWRLDSRESEEGGSGERMRKSKSHPRLSALARAPTDVVASRATNPSSDQRVPKRIRLVNFWARTRFFQRAFMVWMIVWISMIVYNSGIVEYFIANIEKADKTETVTKGPESKEPKQPKYQFEKSQMMFPPLFDVDVGSLETLAVEANDTLFLKHSSHSRPRLSPYHWSNILSQYNESVSGGYVVVIPPVVVSHRVAPEVAASLRPPDEREPPPVRWQALAAALDPIDILPDFDVHDGKVTSNGRGQSELPIYPTTPMEILLLAILCSISVAVIVYMMVVLYRCICSRHYAEWRASWNGDQGYERDMAKQPAVQLVMEAVPLVVSGHSQEVECLVTDGEKIVSSCLQGNVKVWDSQSGEIITNIDRPAYFNLQKELYEKINSKKENTYEITKVAVDSPNEFIANPDENVHYLRKGLSTHLSGLRFRAQPKDPASNLSAAEKTKYDFAKNYRDLYCSDINTELCNGHETKENVDINNLCIRENDYNSRCKDMNSRSNDTELFTFSQNENNFNRSSCKLGNCESDKKPGPSWDWKEKAISESPVWCMDFCNDLIIIGCADGRLEFWEATKGKLLCVWWNTEIRRACSGVTHVKALSGARRVVMATLSGTLTLLRLDVLSPTTGAQVDWRFSTAHRRTELVPAHKRTGSAGAIWTHSGTDGNQRNRTSFSFETELSDGEEIMCARLAHCRPHQQPITEMQSEGGRILTGGQDHVLKVFSSSDLRPLFTLHGHCGPITSSFIDLASPTIAGSGSQDGLLCVWDLHTGACLYSTQAHDGAVTSLAYTASYVVSAGSDERLCIWDRFQGHMLNSIHIGLNYMSRMLPLTHSLLVAGGGSGLTAYDLSTGHVIRRVLLGQSDGCILVRQILPLKDAIVCDYANQLRIVRFPLVSRLADMKSD